MVMNEPEVSGRFSGYVHHYSQDLSPSTGFATLQDRDAITIIRFPALADLAASKANTAYRDRIGPDEDNFREIEGSVALFANEIEVAPGVDDALRKLFVFRNAKADQIEGWADVISKLVRSSGLSGAVINTAKTIEGHFPLSQFDELGLPLTADPAELAAIITELALAHFGSPDAKLLLAKPFRFI